MRFDAHHGKKKKKKEKTRKNNAKFSGHYVRPRTTFEPI